MSQDYDGNETPNAAASLERIFGFLITTERGERLLPEWHKARQGLATVSDYHQVVSRLASVACELADSKDQEIRYHLRQELFGLVERLQSVSPTP